MTCVFHSDCVFTVDIPFHFGIEEFESFLIVTEKERFDENFAGLVIKHCSAVLELTDINTDVDHDAYTPFDQ
jgi:hypothetical protein